MKKVAFTFTFLLFNLLITAQTTINDPNAETRDVSAFTDLDVSSGIQVYLTQADKVAVAISAETAEYRNKIRTTVHNGTLKIYFDADMLEKIKGNKNLKAYVAVKNLNKISVSAGASINLTTPLNLSNLQMKASSGAMVKGEINVKQGLDVEQSSGSIITISGSAENLAIKSNSGSIFKGYDLAATNCDVSTTSGSSIQINVAKEISAHAASGGSIQYKGSGVITSVRTNSGGSISKKG